MADHFSRFEDRLQHLVEGGFARLFAGRLHPREVAVQLVRAMEDRAQTGAEDQRLAPDVYVVRLNAQDHTAILTSQPDLADILAEELVEMARIGGLILSGFPEVRLLADEAIGPHEIQVRAYERGQQIDTTEKFAPLQVAADRLPAPHAMLIVNGDQHIAIEHPILNFGRHRDNHIILDDHRVSRHHAQMRLKFGRYVLFDLESSGGTTVNGHLIREAVLHSGDVIALAGVNLIYVEETLPSDEPAGSSTRPFSPSAL